MLTHPSKVLLENYRPGLSTFLTGFKIEEADVYIIIQQIDLVKKFEKLPLPRRRGKNI